MGRPPLEPPLQRSRRSARIALVMMALALVLACGASSSRPAAAVVAGTPPSELRRGPLADFVPAAGLRWLLVGSPRQIALWPALGPLRARWLDDERLRAFASATGIDLARTEHALAAGFDLGTLYMADASGWVAPPERAFEARLAGSARSSRSHARILRVSGLVGSQPQTLVRVADDLVAIAVGDPTPARVVELRARAPSSKVVAAFEGASLAGLAAAGLRPGAFSFYMLGPLDGEWLGDGTRLLAGAHALSLSLELAEHEVAVRLALSGDWDPVLDRARLLEEWQAFGRSSLGRALSLAEPVAPVDTSGSESLLSLSTRVDAAAFVTGIESLLVGNVADLLELEGAPAPH